MEESNLKKAKGWADAAKSIASVLVGLVMAISSAAFAYSKIYETERNLSQFVEDSQKKYDLLIQRSDKRHKRVVDYVNDLKSMHKEDERRIIELEKDNAGLKGYIKGRKEK